MSKRGRNPNKARVKDKKRLENPALAKLWNQVKKTWEIHDLPGCLELLNKMKRLAPHSPKIRLELGRMQGLLQDYEGAEQSFQRCAELAAPKERTRYLAQAGQLARDFYEPGLAEKFFQQVVDAPDVTPTPLVTFAEICERREPERAAELIDRALAMDPECAPAQWMQGRLLSKAGESEKAEAILQPLLQGEGNDAVRARAGYDLGALLDRAGRYDEAMDAYVLAKSILYEGGVKHRANRAKNLHRVAQMRARLTPEVLRRWQDAGEELQPARRIALLGGHPRSGTTLLEQVLDSHDDIVSAEETSYFRDHVVQPLSPPNPNTPIFDIWEGVSTEELIGARESFFAQMEKSTGGPLGERLLIDKNPSLTLSVGPLVRCFPEMKFLIALRDPRDVVLSCFMQPMFPLQQVNSTWLQLNTAVEEYVQIMGAWREVEPMLPSPHLTVRYEDMVDDLESVARRTLDFLEVPWDERVLNFDEHARSKAVRSPTYAEVTQKIFTTSKGRWRNYQKYLEPYLGKLEPFVKAFGYE